MNQTRAILPETQSRFQEIIAEVVTALQPVIIGIVTKKVNEALAESGKPDYHCHEERSEG